MDGGARRQQAMRVVCCHGGGKGAGWYQAGRVSAASPHLYRLQLEPRELLRGYALDVLGPSPVGGVPVDGRGGVGERQG